MKKKVNVFGKKLPVFVIAIFAMVLVSAALLPYFAQLTGLVTVDQGLTWDGENWDADLVFDFNDEVTTSLDEETFTSPHYLENTADVDAEFSLVTTCAGTTEDCNAGTPEGINWYYEYNLLAEGDQGTEDRVTVLPTESFDTLFELNTISWDANVLAGYMPHVDVFLDNGKTLIFEGAKSTDGVWCDATTPYPDGELTTFGVDRGEEINDATYAWENGDIPGPCGGVEFELIHNPLSEWKTIYGNVGILKLEFEVDTWILELPIADSDVSGIKVNGDLVEVSGLKAGDKLDFNFLVEFPKMLKPDTYTIETKVMPTA